MVRVDPTDAAKVVLRRAGVEPVKRQGVVAFYDLEITNLHRDHSGPPSATIAAIAAAGMIDRVSKNHRQFDRATVACQTAS